MSEYSPGVVQNEEFLARLVFTYQLALGDAANVGPNTLSGFDKRGVSVCRYGVYPPDPVEIARVIKNKVIRARQGNNPAADWVGVIVAQAEKVRKLPDALAPREFCIYDTALADFVSHADVMQAFFAGSGSMRKRRKDIWAAFSGLVPREEFLGGAVWQAYQSLSG